MPVATGCSLHDMGAAEAVEVTKEAIESAAMLLREGEVVAVPTDTVYGLAAAPACEGATAKLFAVKGRPFDVALPIMVHDLESALALCAPWSRKVLSQVGSRLWPGALTVVVARDLSCEFDLGGDSGTIGLRVPALRELRALCRLVGPLAVTSANVHGESPCVTVDELRLAFGGELSILDGGECGNSVSTVVDFTGPSPALLREGSVSLALVLGAISG